MWPLRDEWYKKNSLESIITLSTHVDEVDVILMEANADSVSTVFDFATSTDLFGTEYKSPNMSTKEVLLSMTENADVKFAGGLLIKLALIVRCNTEKVLTKSIKLLKYLNCWLDSKNFSIERF